MLRDDWLFRNTEQTTPFHHCQNTSVQAGTRSCNGKVLQFSLKSLICNTASFWEDLSIEVFSHARYPKALLEGGHDCRLAVRRLWHLKAVSRLMSPHENLMKKVFPKRCRLQEWRKTLISHITAGKGKLKVHINLIGIRKKQVLFCRLALS